MDHPLYRFFFLALVLISVIWILVRKEKFPILPLLGIIIGKLGFLVPAYINGDAEIWELWVLAVGTICLLFEFLSLPGVGFVGLAGAFLFVGGAVIVQLPNRGYAFDMVGLDQWSASITVIGALIVFSGAAVIGFNEQIASSPYLKRFSQTHTLSSRDGVQAHQLQDLIGKEGIALTVLRPSGKIQIDNKTYDGLSTGTWIEKGQPIIVVGKSGGMYTVEGLT